MGLKIPHSFYFSAPSNAAVDEIVRKLLDCRHKLAPEDRPRIIRIGKPSSCHPDVRSICIDSLTDRHYYATQASNQNVASLELEISGLNKRISAMTQKMQDENVSENERKNLHRKFKKDNEDKKRAEKDLQECKKMAMNKNDHNGRRKAVEELFTNADIVATTLNSAMNGQMETYFVRKNLRFVDKSKHRNFSICIMDEASQCVEPEALIPLKLEFSKLIMVGDPAQLPATVSSMAAKEKNLATSLFTRIFKHFEFEIGNKSPIQHLYTQYRMAPEIMSWPNDYFYGGKLRQGDQDRRFPLAQYKVGLTSADFENVNKNAKKRIFLFSVDELGGQPS